MINWLRRLVKTGKFWPVLLESWGLAVAVLVLVLTVVAELPRSNIPTTFIFLSQVPVAWAAFRLRPATASLSWPMASATTNVSSVLLLRLPQGAKEEDNTNYWGSGRIVVY